MTVLVTGGAGYIGSHTCLELIAAGFDILVVDNLCNSKRESLRRVEMLARCEVPFVELDICDASALDSVFADCAKQGKPVSAVIHFAGLKAVGESNDVPLRYYQNNVAGTMTLCQVMENHGVKRLLFSSSATVYGDPHAVPIKEDFPTGATNPYGRSKWMVEHLLNDLCAAPDSDWQATILRYFNPIGAHVSGRIGEDPQGIPNNLLPFVAQVAVGKLEKLRIFGDDYPTPDGTGVRDYIHVVDLARGHVKALQKMMGEGPGARVYNLGTGKGYSVLEVVKAFEAACGRSIPCEVVARRTGDIAECYADPSYATAKLDWQAEYGIERMVADAWRWQSQNPQGYDSEPDDK